MAVPDCWFVIVNQVFGNLPNELKYKWTKITFWKASLATMVWWIKLPKFCNWGGNVFHEVVWTNAKEEMLYFTETILVFWSQLDDLVTVVLSLQMLKWFKTSFSVARISRLIHRDRYSNCLTVPLSVTP